MKFIVTGIYVAGQFTFTTERIDHAVVAFEAEMLLWSRRSRAAFDLRYACIIQDNGGPSGRQLLVEWAMSSPERIAVLDMDIALITMAERASVEIAKRMQEDADAS